MKKQIRQVLILILISSLIVSIIKEDKDFIIVNAEQSSLNKVSKPVLNYYSIVEVNSVFTNYQATVDENIYYALSKINSDTLVKIYGNKNTSMFNKAKETINPIMALATTWGEAGQSYRGISLTTIMDFNPNTYGVEIDWINLSYNIAQVDSSWYIANTVTNYNTNEDGKAYLMPVALLQNPKQGTRTTYSMIDLGVGAYQITSTDWSTWDLDTRVNPIYGFEASLKKCGSNWITCGIDPISDLTVYACLSLGHQGGNLIGLEFGKSLINFINKQYVQDAFYEVGYQMYTDLYHKALQRTVSLSDINVNYYLSILENKLDMSFSSYNGGYGSTNKGWYVSTHCLRYCFYKYYFSKGY